MVSPFDKRRLGRRLAQQNERNRGLKVSLSTKFEHICTRSGRFFLLINYYFRKSQERISIQNIMSTDDSNELCILTSYMNATLITVLSLSTYEPLGMYPTMRSTKTVAE